MTRPAMGMWVAGFDQIRNKGLPSEHVHGALDIAPPVRTEFRESERDLYAAESGELFAHRIRLETEDRMRWSAWGLPWPADEMKGEPYPFANYSEEVYGICLLLLAEKRMYLYAHLNEVPGFLEMERIGSVLKKESEARWVHASFYGPVSVREGEHVGMMGWFGQTVPVGREGCHLHIEAHEGRQWLPHAKRVRLDDELRGKR
jgi:hypothetical protein